MSYNITTNKSNEKVFTVLCNEPGCKAHFDSKVGKGDAWQTVKAQGWFSDSAANHRCVEHKPARKARTPKAEKAATPSKGKGKGTQAEPKVSKPVAKVTKTKSGATVTVGNRVPAKAQPATFSGGQSIGKVARSAKKQSA